MVKADKDRIPALATTSSEEVIIGLWVAVAKHELTMPQAEIRLHEYVNALPEDKQTELRGKARQWGLLLMSVSEAFLQQLTVIGAGQ